MINAQEVIYKMSDTVENVFIYDLNDKEREVLELTAETEPSYLLLTPPLKILSDLHLLFLLRGDDQNRERIMNIIRHSEGLGVEY